MKTSLTEVTFELIERKPDIEQTSPNDRVSPEPVMGQVKAQRDLILANAVCCHEVPGWGSRCNSVD
jgi:hypothetical protein